MEEERLATSKSIHKTTTNTTGGEVNYKLTRREVGEKYKGRA